MFDATILLIGIVVSVGGFFGMWYVSATNRRLDKHGKQIDALIVALNGLNVLVAGDYVKRGEFKEELDKVHDALRKLAVSRDVR